MIDFPREPDDPLEQAREMARQVAAEVLRRNPDAGLGEVNDALARRMAAYNATPQAALGGLSPDRLQRLQLDDWDNTGVLRIREDLPAPELEATSFVHDTLLLLDRLAQGPVRLTRAGNLPRIVVAELREQMTAPVWWPRMLDHVRNEEDLPQLHHLRVLLTVASLARKTRGELRITRRARELAAPGRRGDLFALLFRTWFRHFNLAFVDRAPAAPGFQAMIAFTLYRFHELGGKWRTTGELARLCLLPAVRDELPVVSIGSPGEPGAFSVDESHVPMETRFLRPLVRFGLARVEEPPDPLQFRRRRWRKTPLLDRFLRFQW